MSKQLDRASALAVALTMIATIVTTQGSGVAAQAKAPVLVITEPQAQFTAEAVIQQFAAQDATQNAPDDVPSDANSSETASVPASTLADLVASQPRLAELPRELECLAGAIYFEAKSESLAGQLAVGRVVVARSKSGRFPNSYCGVVLQPSQFSFVQGRSLPAVPRASAQWRKAVAIAQIAHAGTWRSPVEGALFFHAARVSPGWNLRRIAQVENHVFYR